MSCNKASGLEPNIKAIKKKFKIKIDFSFNLVSTDTIKNDLEIKKASSGEIPTYFFKNVILFWALSHSMCK